MRARLGTFGVLLCALAALLSMPKSAAAAAGYSVTITLPEQPPSRIYCVLKEKVSNAEVQVEFDPATSSRLSRNVTVGKGEWLLSCSAEAKPQLITPGRDAGSAPINVAWKIAAPDDASTLKLTDKANLDDKATVGVAYGELAFKDKALAPRDGVIHITATASALPTLKQARAALSTQEGGRIGGRSLDATAPPLVQDTLQILAEIAVERARTRGYAILSDRITELVCEDVKAPGPIPELGISSGQRLLPNTCEAVRNMNLHELAQSGPAVSKAVEKDLIAFALSAAVEQLARNAGQVAVPPKLIQDLFAAKGVDELLRTGKLPPNTVDALVNVLLSGLATWQPSKLGTRSADLVSCGLQTALHAALACYNETACSSDATALAKKIPDAMEASKVGDKTCVAIFNTAANSKLENEFATNLAQAALEHLKHLSTVRSLPDLTLELLSTVSHLTMIYTSNDPNTSRPALARHAGFVFDSLSMLLEPLLSGRVPTPREVQLVLIRLADHNWVSTPPTTLECGLEVAFAAIAACHGTDGGCDARAVADFIAHPEQHFDLSSSGCEPLLVDLAKRGGIQQGWPQVTELVAQGVDIVSPPAGTTPRDQVRSAVSIVFNVASTLSASSSSPRSKEILQHMKALSLGIIDEDARTSIVEGIAIARTALDTPTATEQQTKLLKQIERFTPIVTTLAANATSLKEAAANPDEAESLRKARKDSIEALIDASTDRSNRGGEVVVSLGTGVGFYTGWNAQGGKNLTTLGLPMGLAVQELPGSKKQKAWDTFPQLLIPDHFQATFVDLGQFVAQDQKDLRWNDFLLIGAQVGWIPNFFQSPSDVVVLGADVRYIPGGSRRGDVFVGGFAAYYVPFFDLN